MRDETRISDFGTYIVGLTIMLLLALMLIPGLARADGLESADVEVSDKAAISEVQDSQAPAEDNGGSEANDACAPTAVHEAGQESPSIVADDAQGEPDQCGFEQCESGDLPSPAIGESADPSQADSASGKEAETRAVEECVTVPAAQPPAQTAAADQAQDVTYANVGKLTINKRKVRIKNDGTFRFRVTLTPDAEGKPIKDKRVTWKVSNSKIASITADGLVRGKKNGRVTVTCISANGKTVKATVRVKINKKDMAKRIPVLTYHRIVKNSAKARFFNNTNLVISRSAFKKQMRWLKKHGYRTISTAEFIDWRKNGTFLPKKSVLITIDDGHYETYHVAYPILKKYKLKATSFLVGSRIGNKTSKYNPNSSTPHYIGKDVIKKVAKEYPKLEFQSHSYNMHIRTGNGNGLVKSMSKASIDKDFKKNEKFGFTSIAWPFGHVTKTSKASAKSSKMIKAAFGYMMDHPASRKSSLYNIPRFKVFGDRGLSDFIRIVSTSR